VLKDEPYNQKTDVWALGCILYEIVTLKRAFDNESEEALRQHILSYQIPVLPSHMSNFESISALRDIYGLCMQRKQDDRPTVKDLLSF
jgi:NIMA (never in mitosis gene a)-related kinase 1/4/5